jgi:dTDP-4-amino-4,6-dideoxygalactose transaminase
VEHAWHVYALRLNLERLTIARNEFISELRTRNIGSSVHFIPVHLHQYYCQKYAYKPEDFPIALREYHRIVSLPLSPSMTDEDVNDVIEAVTSIVQRHSIAANSRRRTAVASA